MALQSHCPQRTCGAIDGSQAGVVDRVVLRAAQAIPGSVILDAELAVLDERGHAMFERIRWRAVMRSAGTIAAAAKAQPALLCVFDVLAVGNRDVRPEPLLQRKERLAKLMPSAPGLYLVPYFDTHGEALYQTAVEHGQDGVIGKRADSPYRAGIQPTRREVKNPDFHRQAALGIRVLGDGRQLAQFGCGDDVVRCR